MSRKRHNPGCCCLKTYPEGMTHECQCGCIQLRELTAEDLIRASKAVGVVAGEPIDLTAQESFTVETTLPPLHQPEMEVLVEGFEVRDPATGEKSSVWRATPSSKTIKVGPVVEIELRDLSAVDADKQKAIDKLVTLAGQGIGQAYMRFLTSDDPVEVDAAKLMELGSEELEMNWKAGPAPPCPECGAEFVCAECGDPCMITERCALQEDPPKFLCRHPDDPPPLCAECYTRKALAEEAANEQL